MLSEAESSLELCSCENVVNSKELSLDYFFLWTRELLLGDWLLITDCSFLSFKIEVWVETGLCLTFCNLDKKDKSTDMIIAPRIARPTPAICKLVGTTPLKMATRMIWTSAWLYTIALAGPASPKVDAYIIKVVPII